MTTATLVAVVLVVFAGSAIQRATGMGFAVVAAPFLVILLGPLVGVVLVNFASVVSAAVILVRLRSDVEWRRYASLVIPAVVGIVPGSLLALTLPTDVLELAIGVVLLLALTGSLVFTKSGRSVSGPIAPTVTGFISGATNAAAGVGGPPVSVYALLSGWEHRSFVATVQPYFATIGLISLLTKLAIDPGRWPALDWWAWVTGAAAILIGLVVGDRIAPRIGPRAARWVIVGIAAIGAIVLCFRAVLSLATNG
jgi:uncharacterized membrane protein YfcA